MTSQLELNDLGKKKLRNFVSTYLNNRSDENYNRILKEINEIINKDDSRISFFWNHWDTTSGNPERIEFTKDHLQFKAAK